jgi:hypothetical protein
LFLIGIPHLQAQTGWDYLTDTPERVIGLLDLPDTCVFINAGTTVIPVFWLMAQ